MATKQNMVEIEKTARDKGTATNGVSKSDYATLASAFPGAPILSETVTDQSQRDKFFKKTGMTETDNQVEKLIGRINEFVTEDIKKPSANLVIKGEIFKIYFEENVDLTKIKATLLSKKNKI